MSNDCRCIALSICLKVIFWAYFECSYLWITSCQETAFTIKTITVNNWPCISPTITTSMKNQNTLDTFWIIVNSFLIPRTVEPTFTRHVNNTNWKGEVLTFGRILYLIELEFLFLLCLFAHASNGSRFRRVYGCFFFWVTRMFACFQCFSLLSRLSIHTLFWYKFFSQFTFYKK